MSNSELLLCVRQDFLQTVKGRRQIVTSLTVLDLEHQQ